jgi:hypothetical protein
MLLGVIGPAEQKLNSEQKAEIVFVARHIANALLAAGNFYVSNFLCLTVLLIKL